MPGSFGLRCEISLGLTVLPANYTAPEPEPEPEPEPVDNSFKISNDELTMLMWMLFTVMIVGMVGAITWFALLFLAANKVIKFTFGLFIFVSTPGNMYT